MTHLRMDETSRVTRVLPVARVTALPCVQRRRRVVIVCVCAAALLLLLQLLSGCLSELAWAS